MTNPFRITISPGGPDDQIDPDHAWVEVSGTDPENDSTLAQTLAAHRWVAGIISRLAVELADELSDERTNHPGCFRMADTLRTGCHVTGAELSPTQPPECPPIVTFSVPPHRLRHWTRRIKTQLTQIVAADHWTPTDEDEAAWAGHPQYEIDLQPHHDQAPTRPTVREETPR